MERLKVERYKLGRMKRPDHAEQILESRVRAEECMLGSERGHGRPVVERLYGARSLLYGRRKVVGLESEGSEDASSDNGRRETTLSDKIACPLRLSRSGEDR